MNTLFSLLNLSIAPFWLVMIFAPRWSVTAKVARSPAIAAIPIVAYVALVAPRLPSILLAVANPDLGSIAALLGTPEGALIGWAHFLAFDLLVGRAAYWHARDKGWPVWLSAPTLFLILMVGPLGAALFAVIALARRDHATGRVPLAT